MSSIFYSMNMEAFRLVKDIASPQLNLIMHYLGMSYLIVLPAVALYLYYRKDRNVVSLIVAFVLLYVIGDTIKLIVKEPRPCNVADLSWINQIGCENTYSFPSNHATVLTGIAAFTNKYKYIRALYIIWLLLVLFGRVYLGLHYLTDVIAGVIISLVVVAFIWPFRKNINGIVIKVVNKILPWAIPKSWK